MKEKNPFVCYAPANTTKLVLGSFPCLGAGGYGDFFYSGSGRNHFWPLLSEVTGMPARNAAEKKKICDRHGIALSDVALEVERKNGNCSDANLNIITYNTEGIQRCFDAGAQKVYFTSVFVEQHFKKMFPRFGSGGILLPSPSPAANRHIGGLAAFKELLQGGKIQNVFEYRLLIYRRLLFS